MILMLNMLGYFLGHYPQHFELSDDQRNLILQTMMFFFWLAGGAAVFAKVEGWSFVDSVGVSPSNPDGLPKLMALVVFL